MLSIEDRLNIHELKYSYFDKVDKKNGMNYMICLYPTRLSTYLKHWRKILLQSNLQTVYFTEEKLLLNLLVRY